jgi:nucleoid-associated protein YgaU
MEAGQAIENASQTDMGKEEGVNGYKFEFDGESGSDLQNAPRTDKDISYKDLFNKAIEYVEKAKAAYRDEDYDMAIQYANIAKKIAMSYNGDTLKCRYTVKLIPERRDCLWRISEYSFIYDSPFLWPRIWKANKVKILNPDLIYPGQILDIPNID